MIRIPATAWNNLANLLRFGRPMGGVGVNVVSTYDGSLVTANPAANFQHPWELSGQYVNNKWRMSVRPGFVNGIAPLISMPDLKGTPDVALTAETTPYLTPNWRNPLASTGIDDYGNTLAGESYPAFFKTLGVRKSVAAANAQATYDATDATRTREMRACDIVLITPRLATVQAVDVLNPLTDSQTVAISSEFKDAMMILLGANTYHISAIPKWTAPEEPTALDRLEGTAVEPQTDEIKLATLWIVSPPDTADGEDAVPDGSWVCYPQYNIFWNLAYATRNQPGATPPAALSLITGLLGGEADSIFSELLSANNDATAQLYAYFDAASYKGEYWTV